MRHRGSDAFKYQNIQFSRYRCAITVAACCLTHAVSAAEAPALVSEAEYFADVAPVTSVTRLPQLRSETPAAVTVLDRELIRASGMRDIADLFRLVPGFQVGRLNGHSAAVTYRGLSDQYARRLQVLIDGRSVYGPLLGSVFWSTLPLAIDDIERIEVIRGPNTAAYGANAFLGTINIITRSAVQDPGTMTRATAGNHDIRDGTVRYGWRGAQADMRLSAGYRADDGFDRQPDSQRTPFLNFRGDWQPHTTDRLSVQLGAADTTAETGTVGSPTDPPRDTGLAYYFQQLRWERALAPGEEIGVQLYHNYLSYDDSYVTDPVALGPPFGVVQGPLSFDSREQRIDFEFQHRRALSADARFVWGAGARRERLRSRIWFNTPESLDTESYRAFGNWEWHASDALLFNAGAMYEWSDITGSDVSPRIAVNYHLAPEHTLRVAASKAIRVPVLVEERGDLRFTYQGVVIDQQYLAQGGLRPERMRSYELGYVGSVWRNALSWDIRAYRDRILDFITEHEVPASDLVGDGALSFRNDGEVTVTGADIELTYRPAHATRFVLTFARMRAIGDPTDPSATDSDRAGSVPRHSGSLLATHRFASHWSGSIGYYRVGAMVWMGDGERVPGYDRVDARLARHFRFGRTRGELALGVQNAGDRYVDFRERNLADRRAFLTLQLDLP